MQPQEVVRDIAIEKPAFSAPKVQSARRKVADISKKPTTRLIKSLRET